MVAERGGFCYHKVLQRFLSFDYIEKARGASCPYIKFNGIGICICIAGILPANWAIAARMAAVQSPAKPG